LKDKVS